MTSDISYCSLDRKYGNLNKLCFRFDTIKSAENRPNYTINDDIGEVEKYYWSNK